MQSMKNIGVRGLEGLQGRGEGQRSPVVEGARRTAKRQDIPKSKRKTFGGGSHLCRIADSCSS